MDQGAASFVISIIAVWFAFLGIAVVFQKGGKYLNWTKKTIKEPFKKIWGKHRKEIFWMAVGALIALFFLSGLSKNLSH